MWFLSQGDSVEVIGSDKFREDMWNYWKDEKNVLLMHKQYINVLLQKNLVANIYLEKLCHK
jgi:hypothetical protein